MDCVFAKISDNALLLYERHLVSVKTTKLPLLLTELSVNGGVAFKT